MVRSLARIWPPEGLLPFAAASALLPVIGAGGSARADCATPRMCRLLLRETNTVLVCPENTEDRGYPNPGGMLRQTVSTGEVVLLHDDCVPTERGCGGDCYLDECVPPGRHRYGFADPYECGGHACYNTYYDEIVVAASADECVREAGTTPPSEWEGRVPWAGQDQYYCHYVPPSEPEPRDGYTHPGLGDVEQPSQGVHLS